MITCSGPEWWKPSLWHLTVTCSLSVGGWALNRKDLKLLQTIGKGEFGGEVSLQTWKTVTRETEIAVDTVPALDLAFCSCQMWWWETTEGPRWRSSVSKMTPQRRRSSLRPRSWRKYPCKYLYVLQATCKMWLIVPNGIWLFSPPPLFHKGNWGTTTWCSC